MREARGQSVTNNVEETMEENIIHEYESHRN